MSRSRLLGRLVLAFFFIGVPLAAAGKAGADDSNQIPAFDMRDHHQAAAVRLADQHEPLSLTEWSGSAIVMECGSAKAVAASGNPTPCFRRLAAAFLGSQVN